MAGETLPQWTEIFARAAATSGTVVNASPKAPGDRMPPQVQDFLTGDAKVSWLEMEVERLTSLVAYHDARAANAEARAFAAEEQIREGRMAEETLDVAGYLRAGVSVGPDYPRLFGGHLIWWPDELPTPMFDGAAPNRKLGWPFDNAGLVVAQHERIAALEAQLRAAAALQTGGDSGEYWAETWHKCNLEREAAVRRSRELETQNARLLNRVAALEDLSRWHFRLIPSNGVSVAPDTIDTFPASALRSGDGIPR